MRIEVTVRFDTVEFLVATTFKLLLDLISLWWIQGCDSGWRIRDGEWYWWWFEVSQQDQRGAICWKCKENRNELFCKVALRTWKIIVGWLQGFQIVAAWQLQYLKFRNGRRTVCPRGVENLSPTPARNPRVTREKETGRDYRVSGHKGPAV